MPASDYYISKGEKWTPKHRAFIDRFYGALGEPLNASSTSSLAMGTGSKSLTIEIEKSFAPGQPVRLFYDATNYMDGIITSYDTTTGAMVVNVTSVTGSGTYAVWSVGLVGSTFSTGLTYTEITTATNLAVGNAYKAKNTAATHILPQLSTLTDGDTLTLHETGGDAKVIVNEHAADSNAELATFYVRNDGARFTVVDGVWEVSEEVVTVYGELALTADDSIPISTTEKIFDENYSEEVDLGGWWDAVTSHQLDVGFDCYIDIGLYMSISATRRIGLEVFYDGTLKDGFASGTSASTNASKSRIHRLVGVSYVDFRAKNVDTALAQLVDGNVAKTESKVSWKVIQRIR